jgi:hypothetical protein
MGTVFVGTRTNIEPGKETYTTRHKGTRAYLDGIRCDNIEPTSVEQVADTDCDANGRYIRPWR